MSQNILDENNSDRRVIIEPIEKKQKKSEKVIKEKSKRVITQSKKWIFTENDLKFENQQELLKNVLEVLQNEKKENINKNTKILFQQINQKIYGYKTQDIEKSLYLPTEFINIDYVISRLIECPNCYYCKEPVQLIYEFVREPKQWTLDRIDNSRGHNCDNVEIACLRCNLRRRIMHHERFVFTKQLIIKKSG
uniref:HNH domain-containing protein n=1 Tax=viral metagenome TaxID=1070528 RepID=A0A6C0HZL1_9ZZZZ